MTIRTAPPTATSCPFLDTLIKTKFDARTLPAWARKSPAVVWLAGRDLAFRCDVFAAEAEPYQRALTLYAERVLQRLCDDRVPTR